jgi:hypothetical protein
VSGHLVSEAYPCDDPSLECCGEGSTGDPAECCDQPVQVECGACVRCVARQIHATARAERAE